MDKGICRNIASLLASTCCLPIYLLISLHTQIKHLQNTRAAVESEETEHRPLMIQADDNKDTPEAKLAVFLTKAQPGDDKVHGKKKKKKAPNH